MKTINGIFILSFFLLGLTNIVAAKSSVDTVAIKGYDAVAYFKYSKALKGSDSFAFQWHGMTWYFAKKENRDLFAANPEKYAPQYDGYCAWAMSEGRKAITDPEIWKIVDGKLYLNCSKSAYEKWSKDIPGNIKKADENWMKLYNKQ
ncbi:MAG: YHS domain-containing (seleno)protein [Nitrospirota bacterium]